MIVQYEGVAIGYEAVAIGAAVIVALILIWNRIQLWRRIRAIDNHLAKMQRELYALQMHESRRLIMEMNTTSKVEAQKIDPDGGPVEADRNVIIPLIKTPPTTPAQ